MSSDNIEIKDGMKLRKLTELKTETGKANEEAMLERVEYFKEKNQEKSIFNSTVQNTVVQAFITYYTTKYRIVNDDPDKDDVFITLWTKQPIPEKW